jgi:outer membrane protein, heavy metal efflux system
MKVPGIISLAAATVWLTGCVHFASKPISPEAGAAGFDARSLSSPEVKSALRAEGLPLKFRESLTQLTAVAGVLNPDLAVLRAKVRTAEAALQTAGERPNPVFSLKPGLNSSTRGISPWIVEPGLDFTIETGGKRDARQAVAVNKVRTARLEYLAAAWKVRGEVRRALLAIHSAQASRGLYQSQENAQSEAARLWESRFKDGAATAQDAAAARIPLGLTRISKYDTELLAAKARGQLANAAGVPASALAGVDLDFSEVTRLPAAADAKAMRRHAITHRADILAALSDYAASEESLRLEVAKQYPDENWGRVTSWIRLPTSGRWGSVLSCRCCTSIRARSRKPKPAGPKPPRVSPPCRRGPWGKLILPSRSTGRPGTRRTPPGLWPPM